MKVGDMKRFISAALVVALGVLFAPQALAATMIQGGPFTGLSSDKPTNIHLALSGYPTARGLYVLEAVKPTAGARPTATNAATQLWISADTTGGAASIKGDVVLVVDNGRSWGADCLRQQCGIFIRLDHTATADLSEDQFIPLTFVASTGTSATTGAQTSASSLPADTLTVLINGKAAAANVPGVIQYRTPLTFAVTTGSGVTATLKSYTPMLCPVKGTVVDALKGSGQCDIAVTSPGDLTHAPKTSHFPFLVSPSTQNLKVSAVTTTVGKSKLLPAFTSFGEKITYTTATAGCSVTGRVVRSSVVGSCLVTAKAAGTGNYAALSTTVSVEITK